MKSITLCSYLVSEMNLLISDVLFCHWLFSATAGGILDRSIEAEDKKHGDFMRLVFYFFFSFLP